MTTNKCVYGKVIRTNLVQKKSENLAKKQTKKKK